MNRILGALVLAVVMVVLLYADECIRKENPLD